MAVTTTDKTVEKFALPSVDVPPNAPNASPVASSAPIAPSASSAASTSAPATAAAIATSAAVALPSTSANTAQTTLTLVSEAERNQYWAAIEKEDTLGIRNLVKANKELLRNFYNGETGFSYAVRLGKLEAMRTIYDIDDLIYNIKKFDLSILSWHPKGCLSPVQVAIRYSKMEAFVFILNRIPEFESTDLSVIETLIQRISDMVIFINLESATPEFKKEFKNYLWARVDISSNKTILHEGLNKLVPMGIEFKQKYLKAISEENITECQRLAAEKPALQDAFFVHFIRFASTNGKVVVLSWWKSSKIIDQNLSSAETYLGIMEISIDAKQLKSFEFCVEQSSLFNFRFDMNIRLSMPLQVALKRVESAIRNCAEPLKTEILNLLEPALKKSPNQHLLAFKAFMDEILKLKMLSAAYSSASTSNPSTMVATAKASNSAAAAALPPSPPLPPAPPPSASASSTQSSPVAANPSSSATSTATNGASDLNEKDAKHSEFSNEPGEKAAANTTINSSQRSQKRRVPTNPDGIPATNKRQRLSVVPNNVADLTELLRVTEKELESAEAEIEALNAQITAQKGFMSAARRVKTAVSTRKDAIIDGLNAQIDVMKKQIADLQKALTAPVSTSALTLAPVSTAAFTPLAASPSVAPASAFASTVASPSAASAAASTLLAIASASAPATIPASASSAAASSTKAVAPPPPFPPLPSSSPKGIMGGASPLPPALTWKGPEAKTGPERSFIEAERPPFVSQNDGFISSSPPKRA